MSLINSRRNWASAVSPAELEHTTLIYCHLQNRSELCCTREVQGTLVKEKHSRQCVLWHSTDASALDCNAVLTQRTLDIRCGEGVVSTKPTKAFRPRRDLFYFMKALNKSVDLEDGRSCSSRNRTSLRQTRLTRGRNAATGYTNTKQHSHVRSFSMVLLPLLFWNRNFGDKGHSLHWPMPFL